MSNLGMYQVMTTFAKKVGGPINMFVILVGGGAVIGGGTVGGGIAVRKKISTKLADKMREIEAKRVHNVVKAGVSNEGLEFKIGDQFRILTEIDEGGMQIEILGNKNNPFLVSSEFIKKISDYE